VHAEAGLLVTGNATADAFYGGNMHLGSGGTAVVTILMVADEAISAGDAVSVSSDTDLRVELPDDMNETYRVIGFAVDSATAGNNVRVAVSGLITNAVADGAITRGEGIVASNDGGADAGEVKGTMNVTPGRMIGIALDSAVDGAPVSVLIHKF